MASMASLDLNAGSAVQMIDEFKTEAIEKIATCAIGPGVRRGTKSDNSRS